MLNDDYNYIYVYLLKTHLEVGKMLSFGRGKGASFRAGEESMSPFKADATMASLNLFPRSRITDIEEEIKIW